MTCLALGVNGNHEIARSSAAVLPRHRLFFSPQRWQFLVIQFRETVLSCHGLPPQPMLPQLLKAGLSALRTDNCVVEPSSGLRQDVAHASPTPDILFLPRKVCPTCQPVAQEVAKTMRATKRPRTSSFLRCRLTGLPMVGTDDIFPMVLPNGQSYSNIGLERMAAENDGIIECPATGDSFLLSEAMRAFVV
jgi:hypothetical protein